MLVLQLRDDISPRMDERSMLCMCGGRRMNCICCNVKIDIKWEVKP